MELLPAKWRVVNQWGVKIDHRVYDAEALGDFRRQPSGVKAKNDRWEIHYDPYEIGRIWVRNHWENGWVMAYWKHLRRAPAPFGEMAWDHARQQVADQGRPAAEPEIADTVNALLSRAGEGPADPSRRPSKRDRRVAARTRASAARGQPGWPRPEAPTFEAAVEQAEPGEEVEHLAEVVPLGVFDARKEAEHWW